MKTVLLAEDDDSDLLLMKMACERSGVAHKLRVVTDGHAAIEYLAGTGKFEDRLAHPLPHLVFLDIKMPKRTGLEVLEWIRQQPHLRALPVIMLTSSTQIQDINRAYELDATSYLKKISDPTEFTQAVRIILKYWLELNIQSP